MKIAIIGAGLYGSYFAYMLSKNKKLNIDLFDKENKILNSTAKKNQYRLHIGYHYPRSKETIIQTMKGYNLFKKQFRKFLYFPKKNYYLVHNKSKINFKEYMKIFKSYNLNFKEVGKNQFSKYMYSNQISGCLNTDEGVILIENLISYLTKKLEKKVNIYKGTEINKIDSLNGIIFSDKKKINNYDVIINTTYENPNLGLNNKKFKLKFELTAIVKIIKPFKEQLGLTIMDGPFVSLYPQNQKESTISSVKYTPVFKSKSFKKINDKLKILNKSKIKENIINHSLKFLKLKKSKLKPKLILSHKVKLMNDKNDTRASAIINENKLISVLCGKIDAAPVIYYKIQKIIKKNL